MRSARVSWRRARTPSGAQHKLDKQLAMFHSAQSATTPTRAEGVALKQEAACSAPPPVNVQDFSGADTRQRGDAESSGGFSCCGRSRQLPMYDTDIPLFAALFSWHGTILPLVVRRSAFWVLWLSHVLFLVLLQMGQGGISSGPRQ